ncbi:hypothetical protein T484DRAFT_1756219 [Baffinella frigidus]|nr:hypothetical protein T484DRAFT_1756219 [Cryptophyta sp. CCMP2293]
MRILGAILAAFLLAVLPLESLGSADSCPRAIPVPPAARLSRRIWNAGDPLAARFLPALRGGGEPKPAKDGESGTLAQLLVARDVDAVYAAIATAKGELDAECLSIAMHRQKQSQPDFVDRLGNPSRC